MSAGGAALYIKDTFAFRLNEYSQQKLPNTQHLLIDIQTKRSSIAVGVIYRHLYGSGSGKNKFNEEIDGLFFTLKNNKRPLYCFGDFNINFLKLSDKAVIC